MSETIYPQKEDTQVLWFGIEPCNICRKILQELHTIGYQTTETNSWENLSTLSNERQHEKLLLCDKAGSEVILPLLIKAATWANLVPAKKILLTHSRDAQLSELAAAYNFRDIVPVADISLYEILFRLKFSIANRPIELAQALGGLTQNVSVRLKVPSRIIWFNSKMIRIETAIKAPIGTQLQITSPLFEKLGTKVLKVTVKEISRRQIHYRFSNALICSWHNNSILAQNIDMNFHRFKRYDSGYNYRIFLAISNTQWRNELSSLLNHQSLNLIGTTKARSLAKDPAYISPDMIIIEKSMMDDEAQDDFCSMLSAIEKYTPIFALGEFTQGEENYFRSLAIKHQIFFFQSPDELSLEQILDIVAPNERTASKGIKNAIYLAKTDPLSFARIVVDSKLKTLHPNIITMTIPFPITNFSMVQIQSQVIKKWCGRYYWLKMIKMTPALHIENGGVSYFGDFLFLDLTDTERKHLLGGIVNRIKKLPQYSEEKINPLPDEIAVLTQPNMGNDPKIEPYEEPIIPLDAKPLPNSKNSSIYWLLLTIGITVAVVSITALFLLHKRS